MRYVHSEPVRRLRTLSGFIFLVCAVLAGIVMNQSEQINGLTVIGWVLAVGGGAVIFEANRVTRVDDER